MPEKSLVGPQSDSWSDEKLPFLTPRWQQLVSKGRLDIVEEAEVRAKAERLADVGAVRHTLL